MNKEIEINTLIEDIDRVIHEPARLMILIYLNTLAQVDFTFLLFKTGLTKGNLSSHLLKLEQAEYIEINKQFINKMPNTAINISDLGKKKLDEYQNLMITLFKEIE